MLEFGQMPMLKLDDGTRLCQTTAILEYVGATYGYKPASPLECYKGLKAVEHTNGDYVLKYLVKAMFSQGEDKEKLITDAILVGGVKFFDSLTKTCLGDSKFLCGEKVSIYDFSVAGFFTNMVLNPKSAVAPLWAQVWEKAPERLQKYISDFQAELCDYLEKRAVEHPEVTY